MTVLYGGKVMPLYSHLSTADLAHRRVFLRADLNVPLSHEKILCDFRLKSLVPTLDLLIAKKARIILGTHLGRPQEQETTLSTHILTNWFIDHGYRVLWEPALEKAYQRSFELDPGQIMLLENLRFFQGEQSSVKEVAQAFAEQLHALGDYYVNDAFALLHRHDTSITLLPDLYTKENKTIGLLVEHEYNELEKLFKDPARPFMLILGGGKVKDKVPFIEKLLDTVDCMIILPALAFTFLKAQGIDVGSSLVDDTLLEIARTILTQAQEKSVRIILPIDFMVLNGSLDGPISFENHIPQNGIGIAVGPKSLELFKKEVSQVKTVFINGAMGLTQRPETLEPLFSLLTMIADMPICSIIGGGESVAAVYSKHLEHSITYCSTGGGASLSLLIYGKLPALSHI